MIALIDATYFLIFNTVDETCDLQLYKVLSATLFFSTDPYYQHYALVLQLKSSITLFKTFFIMAFLLNSFLCIDLYLTVKVPFTPAKSRFKFYVLFSVLVSVSISIFIMKRYSIYSSEGRISEELTVLGAFIIFLAVAIPSTIFASARILRKGISDDVRKSVI